MAKRARRNGCDFNLLDTAFAGSENVTMSVIRNVPTSFDCQIKIARGLLPQVRRWLIFLDEAPGPVRCCAIAPAMQDVRSLGGLRRRPPWIDRCTCPGAADHKDAQRHRRELSDQTRSIGQRGGGPRQSPGSQGSRESPGHLRKPSANEDWSSTPTKRICCARRSKSDKCQGRCEIFRHSAL